MAEAEIAHGDLAAGHTPRWSAGTVRPGAGLLLLGAAGMAVPMVVDSGYYLYLFALTLCYFIGALGLTVIVGTAGLPSFGHGAFFGLGAYAVGIATTNGLAWPVGVVLAIVVATVFGLLLGLPSLRVGDLYLAIVTLGIAVIFDRLVRAFPDLTGGVNGLFVDRIGLLGDTSDAASFRLVVLLALVATVTTALLLRSRHGRAMRAFRDSPSGAAAYGIDARRYKLLAFIVGSWLGALGGVAYAEVIQTFGPDDFGILLALDFFLMIVVGGLGSIKGALIGAAIVSLLPALLPTGTSSTSTLYVVSGAYGVIIIALVLLWPGGIAEALQRLGRLVRPGERSSAPTTFEDSTAWLTLPTGSPSRSAHDAKDAHDTTRRESPLVHVQELVVNFGGNRALDGATVGVLPRTIHGLVGPNGAGKTTLFNCISGFVPPNAGVIEFRGRRIDGLAPHRHLSLGIARTFQNLALFETMSVQENLLVAAGAGTHGSGRGGMGPAPSEVMQLLGLQTHAATVVDELPYGWQKRVELARALSTGSDLVLLDEPVAGLTREEAKGFAEVLSWWRDEFGVTFLVIEHNMGFVMGLCDTVSVLAAGRVLREGSPEVVSRDEAVIEAYLGREHAED